MTRLLTFEPEQSVVAVTEFFSHSCWKGKRVVITGGSRGLGLVIARQLADQGARMAIIARSAGDLEVRRVNWNPEERRSRRFRVTLSNGLRAESKHKNIFVTTACPGLMRTGSPRNALFKGKHREEFAWFNIGDSLPWVSMHAEQAADQIIRGCEEGRGEFIVTSPMNIAIHLQSLFLELTPDVLAAMGTLLPTMGGIGQKAVRGYESESAWSPSMLTQLTQEAAERNNQLQYGSSGMPFSK